MSGLGRFGGAPLDNSSRPIYGLGVERVYTPDMLQNPNRGWPVDETPMLVIDVQGGSGAARRFSPSHSSGFGFNLFVPDGATKMLLRLPHRRVNNAEDGATIAPRLYARKSQDAGWTGPLALGIIHLPPNNLFQTSTFPAMLKLLELEGGDYAQFIFARYTESKSDTLDEDWHLFGLGVAFV